MKKKKLHRNKELLLILSRVVFMCILIYDFSNLQDYKKELREEYDLVVGNRFQDKMDTKSLIYE